MNVIPESNISTPVDQVTVLLYEVDPNVPTTSLACSMREPLLSDPWTS